MSSPLPPPRVVAVGGGHGLAASLTALRAVTDRLTAIVTVADDGGSSGRLRRELAALPPGDLRMALAALADGDPPRSTWAAAFQHRFGGTGPLAGHALGNLVLTALVDVLGDPVQALALAGRLLGLPEQTQVLPMSTVPLEIHAAVVGLDPAAPDARRTVCGQVAIATTTGDVVSVWLRPEEPPAAHEGVAAVLAADWVVLGPGSWFTSVLPHLLVPGLAAALQATSARRLVVLNLAPQKGETDGFSPEAHLEAMLAHAPWLRVDVVLADRAAVPDPAGLAAAAARLNASVVLASVAMGDGTARHDPLRLAASYVEVLGEPARGRPTAAGLLASGPLASGPLPSGPLPSGPLPSGPLPSGPLPSGQGA